MTADHPVKPPLPTHTRRVARRLRRDTTDAERALWCRLRGGRLGGLKFRRQHPLPPYVADFYCDEARLVIELDGSQHAAGVDAARTAAFERQRIAVLRFWDNDVLARMDVVLVEILRVARARIFTRRCAPSAAGAKAKATEKDAKS